MRCVAIKATILLARRCQYRYTEAMEPANTIIQTLGGATRIANEIGIHRVSVSKWKMPKDKGGTGGVIPISRVIALLMLSERLGKCLTADDFIPNAEKAAST